MLAGTADDNAGALNLKSLLLIIKIIKLKCGGGFHSIRYQNAALNAKGKVYAIVDRNLIS